LILRPSAAAMPFLSEGHCPECSGALEPRRLRVTFGSEPTRQVAAGVCAPCGIVWITSVRDNEGAWTTSTVVVGWSPEVRFGP
jgi:hypothetical protein